MATAIIAQSIASRALQIAMAWATNQKPIALMTQSISGNNADTANTGAGVTSQPAASPLDAAVANDAALTINGEAITINGEILTLGSE